ncbi:MAG TPA: hypothetical protein VF625_17020 [Longimicrobium sp.]|jgi:hypothetical protein
MNPPKSKRVPPRWLIPSGAVSTMIGATLAAALFGWILFHQSSRGCLKSARAGCDPDTSFPERDTLATPRIDPCGIPASPPIGLPADTFSPESRCAALRTAWGELRRAPDAEPHIAPGDTARIESARVFDIDQEDGITGVVTPLRQVELDIRSRPRLFVVAINRRTGAVRWGIVHR